MRKIFIIGAVALIAGMAWAIHTLASSPVSAVGPAKTTIVASLNSGPTSQFSQAIAGTVVATDTPVPTDTLTPTPAPPTPTPLPPTPTPTVAPPVDTGHQPAPAVNAEGIAVIDEASGVMLYGKNPHMHLAPASITKIATALVALSHANPSDEVTVKMNESELVDSTLMGIKPGETYTLEDLLYGLLLPSGNDAALAIANYVAGSEPAFAQMMNQQAADLGLHDTHFVNAHGLDVPGHYTSAYDITMMARYGMMHYPLFAQIVRTNAWDVHGTRSYTVYNLNRFLRSYPGADGVKIGYTDNAGKTIVASATRNGHRVYVTLMHCGDIVNDTVPLFNWVFKNYTWPS